MIQAVAAAETQPQTEPSVPVVINFALSRKRLCMAEALDNAGFFQNASHHARGHASMLKRITRALYRKDDLSDPQCNTELRNLQSEYKQLLGKNSVIDLAQQGAFGTLVKRYLGILIKQNEAQLVHLKRDPLQGEEADAWRLLELEDRARDNIKKYNDELTWYNKDSSSIDEAAKAHPLIVSKGVNLPYGQIAALVLAGNNQQVLAANVDFASDISCVQEAREVLTLMRKIPSTEDMKRYQDNPDLNDTRIQAAAKRIANTTKPLSADCEFEPETPEAAAIFAAKELLFAQLRKASTQLRSKEQMAAVEQKAQQAVKDYAQALTSLTLGYLQEGASKDDPRIAQVAQNLRDEAASLGITEVMPLQQAKEKMASLARLSAEDLLQVVKNDPALTKRLMTLAKSAGVDTKSNPLAPKPFIIGTDLMTKLEPILGDTNTIIPGDFSNLLDDLKKQFGQGKGPAGPRIA